MKYGFVLSTSNLFSEEITCALNWLDKMYLPKTKRRPKVLMMDLKSRLLSMNYNVNEGPDSEDFTHAKEYLSPPIPPLISMGLHRE